MAEPQEQFVDGAEVFQEGLLPREKADSEGFVWNFAFGANMNPLSFIKRRGINPVVSVPGRLKNWQLTFDIRGFPFFEPVFGNIQHRSGCELHGVLHKISIEDFWTLQRTEGGGGVAKRGYYPILLPVTAYDGQRIMAWALKSYPATEMNNEEYGVLPSERYLTLLRNGARHYKLDANYIRYLDSLKGQRNSLSHYLIGGILAVLLSPLVLVTVLLGRVCKINYVQDVSQKYIYPGVGSFTWALRKCLPGFLVNSNREIDCRIPVYTGEPVDADLSSAANLNQYEEKR